MEILANREHMKLLYGSPTTYCFVCHAFLNDPEKAHPRQHPTRPFQTVAFCDACNCPPATSNPEPPPNIQSPRLQRCESCDEFFSMREGPKRYCSNVCAVGSAPPPTTSQLKKVSSRKSCGPCDCEDFQEKGCCTMVAQAEMTPEELRNAILEPAPCVSPWMYSLVLNLSTPHT